MKNKTGLDDFLCRHTADEFRTLPTTEIFSLEERVKGASLGNYRDLLPEIAKREPIEQESLCKLLSKSLNVSGKAVKDRVKPFIKADSDSSEQSGTPCALSESIIDICEHDGRPVFLTSDGQVVPSISGEGGNLCPPSRGALPFSLPQAEAVLEALGNDTDGRLYQDIRRYLYEASDLPADGWYDLLTAWVLHTYLIEKVEYSPYIWFYAVPERGKSRTGKALSYVAYRGLHVESLRDAYLVRISRDLGVSLFIDVTELWKKAEKNGTEDILLCRYERGARVPRVLYPDKGAHNDIVYFSIFGPTLIATNETVPAALDTRSIQINMQPATRKFQNDVTPKLALPLKARLVAFRYRHRATVMPDIEKPSLGRLGDILKPLAQVVRLVQPEREQTFMELVKDVEERRGIDRGETMEAKLVKTILDLEGRVVCGRLLIKTITDEFNKDKPERYHSTPKTIAGKLTALGFIKTRSGRDGSTAIQYDQALIKKLALAYLETRSASSVSSTCSPGAALDTEGSTEGTEASNLPSISASVKTDSNHAGFEGTEGTEAKNRCVSKEKTPLFLSLDDTGPEPEQGGLWR